MPSTLELRWSFAPDNLFEEDLSCNDIGAEIDVGSGTVVARLPTEGNDARPAARPTVEKFVEGLFHGVQLVDHTNWSRTGPSVCILHSDGTRNLVLEPQAGAFHIRTGRVDIRVTNADGTVVDTRRERIQRKHRLALTAAALLGSDATLARMIRSYRRAIEDPQDELIHLFEVRDSISSRFGSQTEAIRQLGFRKTRWSRLGQLCNELPLREGRHRGRFGPEIRPATEAELLEARAVAVELIESYIQHTRGAA